jgi:hypothetical protein
VTSRHSFSKANLPPNSCGKSFEFALILREDELPRRLSGYSAAPEERTSATPFITRVRSVSVQNSLNEPDTALIAERSCNAQHYFGISPKILNRPSCASAPCWPTAHQRCASSGWRSVRMPGMDPTRRWDTFLRMFASVPTTQEELTAEQRPAVLNVLSSMGEQSASAAQAVSRFLEPLLNPPPEVAEGVIELVGL